MLFQNLSFLVSELSKVLENTAFFTDLIVRFPKPSHIFYKRNKNKWKKIMTEAINICQNSGVFDGDYATLLHNVRVNVQCLHLLNQIFHYTCCITPKCVTSLRGPFLRHCNTAPFKEMSQ